MRKGALNDVAKSLNCNKVALGHNKDDVIQTLLLSMFYEGRIYTFSPVSYLDRTDLYTIRPLIYVPEKGIINFSQKEGLPIVISPCPADGNTKREKVKNLIYELSNQYDNLENHLFGAIQNPLLMVGIKKNTFKEVFFPHLHYLDIYLYIFVLFIYSRIHNFFNIFYSICF